MKTAGASRKPRARQTQRPPGNQASVAGNPPAMPVISLVLVLITIAIYYPVCGFEFLSWDDPLNITQNTHLNGPGGPEIGYFWRHSILLVYRPMIYTVWSLAAIAARLPKPIDVIGVGSVPFDAHVFHAVNLILHCANVVLAFAVLLLLLGTSNSADSAPPHKAGWRDRRLWAAAAGALLFSIHPIQVDSVAWITACNGVLFGFFALLSLWQFIHYAQTSRSGGPASRVLLHYVLASAFFILALLTYPMAVALPLVALAVDYWIIRRPVKQALAAQGPWVLLSLIFVYIAASARHLQDVPIHVAWWARPLIAGDTFAAYLYQLIWPVALGPDNGRTPDYVLGHAWGYVTWLVPAVIGMVLWLIRRRQPVLVGAACVFAAALLPVTGLITNAYQTYSTTADRYVYLPLFGISLAVAWGIAEAGNRKGASSIAACISLTALAGCSVLTVRHVQDYRNNEAFYTRAFTVNPASWMAYQNLGKQMVNANRLDEAVSLFQKALAVKKPFAGAHNDLGIALGKLGRRDEAIAEVQKAISEEPNNATWYTQLGIQYSETKQNEKAIAAFQQALRLKPGDLEAEKNLGTELGLAGRYDEAIAQFNAVLQADPANAQTEDKLAYNFARKGDMAQAVMHWQKAVTLKPDFAKAHYNLGVALSSQGKRDEAIAELRASLSIDPNYPPAQQALTKAQQGITGR